MSIGLRRARAFTILELMLAATVMALVSLAILAVFKTATRTFTVANREVDTLQRAQHVFDVVGQDLQSVFYRDETSYNVQIAALLDQYERARLAAEESGDMNTFESQYGPKEPGSNDSGGMGNPFEKGIIIDLAFHGDDQAKKDKLTFAKYQSARNSSVRYPWGLSRVSYSNDGALLVRSQESIMSAPRSWNGEEQPKEPPPNYQIVSEGVKEFDLAYGFWYDNQWYEVNAWDSSSRQVRNPNYFLGEHERQVGSGNGRAGTPEYNSELNDSQNEMLDRLPAYVRMRVVIEDPKGDGKARVFTSLVRMPQSQETWFKTDLLTEDEQEGERRERDHKYVAVFPGALAGSSRR